MSERPADPSADWRRQRRRRGSQGEVSSGEADSQEVEADGEPEGSRTLFSFLEPGLDLIGSFGAPIVIAGIFALIVGVVLAAFVPALRLYGFIVTGVGVVLLAVMALIYLSSVLSAFISRTGRYGVNSLIMLAAFLGIVVVLNFITFSNNARIDTTANQQFSLANSTRNLLRDLEEPVRAVAFFREDIPYLNEEQLIRRVKVEDTLSEFSNRSSMFSYELVDPDISPETARNLGVTVLESIAIQGQESKVVDIVHATDQFYTELEQDLYTSILVATGQEQRKVYFLSGHGEKSLNGSGGDGYASIKRGLQRDNYRPETLRWNAADEEISVPDDAALLVIAGPSGELPEAHVKALDNYLLGRNADGTNRREGGRIVFLAEPDTPESFKTFLFAWGVIVDEGYILDRERSVPGNPQTLRVGAYNPGAPPEIVFPRGTSLNVSFMPGATPVRAIDDGSGARIPIPLAITSADSFLIDDVERTEPVTDGEEPDPTGVFTPALYVQGVGPINSPAPTSQPADYQISGIVVFGDSDFISNSFVERGSNAALFLNTANYLMGDFSLVSIRDRQYIFREFNLDKNQFNFVRFSSWFFLPGLMGLLAALVWWLRR